MDKKRIVKDYDKLPEEVLTGVKEKYPQGFVDHLIGIVNKEGNKVSALPFETEDAFYLIRMTVEEAKKIHLGIEDAERKRDINDAFSPPIPDDEFDGADEDISEDDEDVTVRMRGKRGSTADDDEYDQGSNEPSEAPDYF